MAPRAYNIQKKVMYIRFNPTSILSNHVTYRQVNLQGHKAQQPLLEGEKGKGGEEKTFKMAKDGNESSHCCPRLWKRWWVWFLAPPLPHSSISRIANAVKIECAREPPSVRQMISLNGGPPNRHPIGSGTHGEPCGKWWRGLLSTFKGSQRLKKNPD